MPFLTHVDPDLGAFLDPFWHPNRCAKTQIQALSFSKMRIVTKSFKNQVNVDDVSARDGSENDLKMTQDQSKTAPKPIIVDVDLLLQFFGPFWAPFWLHFGTLLGSKIDPKSDKKSIKI